MFSSGCLCGWIESKSAGHQLTAVLGQRIHAHRFWNHYQQHPQHLPGVQADACPGSRNAECQGQPRRLLSAPPASFRSRTSVEKMGALVFNNPQTVICGIAFRVNVSVQHRGCPGHRERSPLAEHCARVCRKTPVLVPPVAAGGTLLHWPKVKVWK